MSTPFVLVDGSSYLFRAFHALPPLVNSKGQPTGACYGVVAMLKKLLQEHRPAHMAVVFDAKGPTFRNDLYPDYKANRPPMPEELRVQIAPLHALVQALGLPLLMIEGVEADDVIGTLARQASAQGREVLISTSDKDMAQLVDAHVRIANSMTNTLLGPAEVTEKFGVPPERIIDWLTLMGDKVDNIPGVPGVGEKTAVKLLLEHGSLEGVIAAADAIKGKLGENLRASLGQLPLSRELATIKCDVALDLGFDDLRPQLPDVEKLRALYSELEFKSWLKEVLNTAPDQAQLFGHETPKIITPTAVTETAAVVAPTPSTLDRSRYQTLLTLEDLQSWLSDLQNADVFGFDTETTSLDARVARVVGLSFALSGGRACYLPIAHDYLGAPVQLPEREVWALLKPLLESETHKKVGHNLKYDAEVLRNHAIELRGIAYDTMLESYVLDATGSRHDLDTLALKLLGHENISFESLAGKGKDQLTFNQIEVERAAPYAAEDADVTLRLHEQQWPRLEADEKLRKVFSDLEIPLVPVLIEMESTGVLLDAGMLRQQSRELGERIAELETEAHTLAGRPFNLSSPKQLGQIFFEEMKLPVVSKTPTGAPSTNEEVLEELALDYPLPKVILQHRSLSKLKSTYTEKLPELISPKTGRVHTSFHQAVTSTGRLSSMDPNLQNIPIRTAEGRKIRKAFIAPAGWKVMAADYSQIELRIMAHLSQDAGLIRAFQSGEDVHRATASEIFEIDPQAVTSDQRRSAKAINFGLIYGMSAFGLARQLGIGRDAAQHYMHRYFARYPGVEQYMNDIREKARQLGYVETLFGRRLYLPEIKASNMARRKGAERVAINAPMQGTAADIVKAAMIRVHHWIKSEQVPARLLLQVHDELVLEVQEHAIDSVREALRTQMSQAAELCVPLLVEVGVGNSWDEAH